MFAVIKTGGKQYRVAAQDLITIEKREAQPGDAIESKPRRRGRRGGRRRSRAKAGAEATDASNADE